MSKTSFFPHHLPDFWDFIIDAAEQDRNEFVEI